MMATVPKAKDASPPAGLEVNIQLHRSFGTTSGMEKELPALQRFLVYQLQRFLMRLKLTGKWTLMVYVSREPDRGE